MGGTNLVIDNPFARLGGALHARLRLSVGLALTAGVLYSAGAHAITTISQGYQTSDQVALGSIVSLDTSASDHVSSANLNNAGTIVGVVIDPGNSLLSLQQGQNAQIQVANSGVAQVMVSDINGSIHNGDQITASPISGVGMKATVNSKVVGVAQDNLNDNNSSEQTYTDKKGVKHKVRLGQVPTLLNVSYFYKQPEKTVIPSALQNVANALAGKQVSAAPILVSLGIFVVMIVVVASIIYSMIRSSIISVGRNPMSQSAIYRNLVQMSALVLGILAVGVVAIYMVLTKL